jgi:hypothetical protein
MTFIECVSLLYHMEVEELSVGHEGLAGPILAATFPGGVQLSQLATPSLLCTLS